MTVCERHLHAGDDGEPNLARALGQSAGQTADREADTAACCVPAAREHDVVGWSAAGDGERPNLPPVNGERVDARSAELMGGGIEDDAGRTRAGRDERQLVGAREEL
jgi:hypothetical protein